MTPKLRAYDPQMKWVSDQVRMFRNGRVAVDWNEIWTMEYMAEQVGRDVMIVRSTGMVDQTGKEIYEGDRLTKFGETFTVTFENGKFKAVVSERVVYDLKHIHPPSCQIIGNIHLPE